MYVCSLTFSVKGMVMLIMLTALSGNVMWSSELQVYKESHDDIIGRARG